MDELHKLAPSQQAWVLDYARSLNLAKGIQGKDLLAFSNTIEATDLEHMSKAIEKGCEQVNLNEW